MKYTDGKTSLNNLDLRSPEPLERLLNINENVGPWKSTEYFRRLPTIAKDNRISPNVFCRLVCVHARPQAFLNKVEIQTAWPLDHKGYFWSCLNRYVITVCVERNSGPCCVLGQDKDLKLLSKYFSPCAGECIGTKELFEQTLHAKETGVQSHLAFIVLLHYHQHWLQSVT